MKLQTAEVNQNTKGKFIARKNFQKKFYNMATKPTKHKQTIIGSTIFLEVQHFFLKRTISQKTVPIRFEPRTFDVQKQVLPDSNPGPLASRAFLSPLKQVFCRRLEI